MRLHVHMLRDYGAQALAHLQAQLDPRVWLTLGPHLPQPANYHILVGGRPKREHLTASPYLCALIIPWAGLPEETLELLREHPHIAVHNLHYNAVPVAEMAVTLLLAAAKRIVPIDRSLRTHDWTPRYRPVSSILLEGKTALVLGYGAVGQHVARMCSCLGMKVIATRRVVATAAPDTPDEIHPPEELHRLLPRANALIICLPRTAATDGLIGAEELALLPPDAVLVNVGRGAVVDEAALYNALRDGALYGAGLDVWYNYPSDEIARASTAPSVYPFHELDNVVMSPHRAGAIFEKERRRMTHLAPLLNAAARGEPMPNRVDLEFGY